MLILIAVSTVGLSLHETQKEQASWASIAIIIITAILLGGFMSWVGLPLQ